MYTPTTQEQRKTGTGSPAQRPVGEVMSSPPLWITAAATLGQALQQMATCGVRHLVVVDTAGNCAGVLDDRTVVAAWAANPAAMTCDRISTVLPRTAAVIAADASVLEAARIMHDRGVDAVAVLDRRGVATGIVTGVDLIALLAG